MKKMKIILLGFLLLQAFPARAMGLGELVIYAFAIKGFLCSRSVFGFFTCTCANTKDHEGCPYCFDRALKKKKKILKLKQQEKRMKKDLQDNECLLIV